MLWNFYYFNHPNHTAFFQCPVINIYLCICYQSSRKSRSSLKSAPFRLTFRVNHFQMAISKLTLIILKHGPVCRLEYKPSRFDSLCWSYVRMLVGVKPWFIGLSKFLPSTLFDSYNSGLATKTSNWFYLSMCWRIGQKTVWYTRFHIWDFSWLLPP